MPNLLEAARDAIEQTIEKQIVNAKEIRQK